MDILEQFKQAQVKTISRPDIKPGDTVRVHTRIEEGKKTRVQVFEGTVLSVRGSGPSRMFTVQRLSSGWSVERIFPLMSPLIQEIEITRRQKVRRTRLGYLRQTKRRRVKEDLKSMEAHQEEIKQAEESEKAEEQAKAPETSKSEEKPAEKSEDKTDKTE